MTIPKQVKRWFVRSRGKVDVELQSIIRRHALIVTWIAIFVYPFWGVLDYLFANEYWRFFLTLRVIESICMALGVFLLKRNKIRPELLGYITFLGITLQISYMCNVVQDTSLLTYLLGFSTAFIGANLVLIWRPIHSILVFVGTLVSFFIFFSTISTISIFLVIKNGGLLFLTIALASTFVSWLHYTFRRREVVARLKLATATDKLGKAYREITDNVKYAKRIQDAVLYNKDRIYTVFNEYFVFMRAKGVVSGDFYWTSSYEFYRKTGRVAVAAVDCTGHGISGAFLTFIGETYLNQIINIKEVISPDDILMQLNEGVREMLRQDRGNAQDGMDIALCVIDHRERVVEFAGAHNPLVYVQDGNLHQIKGDRMSIGGRKLFKHRGFKKHIIPLSDEPTSFYLFSDGFVDQIGEKNGHKYMIKRFRGLLESISDKPMTAQKERLEKTFMEWKGNAVQIDDTMVIGFTV